MADNAERGVVFTLKAQVDPSGKNTISVFSQEIQDAFKKSAESSASAAAQSTASMTQAHADLAQSARNSASTIEKATDSVVDYERKAASEIVESWKQSAIQQAQVQSQSNKSIAQQLQELETERVEIRRVSADQERSDLIHANLAYVDIVARRAEAEEKLRIATERGAKQTQQEMLGLVLDLRNEEIKVEEEIAKAKVKFREADKKERAYNNQVAIIELRRRQEEEERAATSAQRRNEQISASAGRIISAMSEGTEAVMRFARGISHLGLIGETDLQKLTDSLLAIQGTTEIFTGLIRTIKQVSEGWDAYRRMVILTTEAQIALNAAQATGVAISAASGGVGQRAAGSAIGGIAGGVAGGAIGGAAGGSILGSMVGGVAGLGTAATGATSLTIGGSTFGLAAGGSALAVGAGVIASFVGALAGAVSGLLTFREALKFGVGGGATQGSIVEAIGTSSFNPFVGLLQYGNAPFLGEGEMSVGGQRDETAKRLTEAEKFRANAVKMAAEDERRINELVRERETLQRSQEQSQREANAHRMSMLTAEERRADIINQIAKAENDQSLGLQERARQVKSLSEQRLQVEREIYQEQRRAAQETLDKAKQELATKEQQLRTAQEAAMSAQERFGLLAPEEQQALLEARQQFQAGAGNVDVEQLRKLRGFSGALDEQIAGEARRRAQQAGFGAFQGEDLRRIQQLEAERQRIQVQVQAQANVIAKLEIDVESVSKEINKQISAQWKTILEDLASNIATLQANENKLTQQRIGRFNRVGP